MNPMTNKAAIITWDWKEQPDWEDVNFALIEVPNIGAKFWQVDSGSDQFAVVFGQFDDQKQAQLYFDANRFADEEDDQP